MQIKPYQTIFQWVLGSMMLLGMLGVILLPDQVLFSWASEYMVHLMCGYLGLGFVFLVAKQPSLLFTSFFCCASLCLFLKNASSSEMILAKASNMPFVNIAQINIAATNDSPDSTLSTILKAESDIISIQEVTPDWGDYLKKELSEIYPFHCTVYRPEDFLGLAIYSKYPFNQLDTFYYNDVPNIAFSIKGNNDEDQIHFVGSYIYPNIGQADATQIEGHFNAITNYIQKQQGPIITFGDYNQMQWSQPIQDFRWISQLEDSRRFPYFDSPSDHIFYSTHFDCTHFETIHSPSTRHLGVFGHYQLKPIQNHAFQANQKF